MVLQCPADRISHGNPRYEFEAFLIYSSECRNDRRRHHVTNRIYVKGRISVVAGFLALVYLFAVPQERKMNKEGSTGSVEETILQIERETFDAIQKKNAENLSRIIADDFVYRTPTGPDVGRAEFLNSIAAIPEKILSVWGEAQKVSVYGDIAVLTGVQRAKILNNDGKEEISSGAFTDVFARRGGRWVMVLAYSVDLPSPTPRE
jgi:ketosteroid isomerase-like protein